MKTPMICAVILAALGMPGVAETKYDRKLERAVMEIVAAKMGALRGGFPYDIKPAFVVIQEQPTTDPVVTGSIAARGPSGDSRIWRDSLALAAERKVSRVILF